MLELLYKDGYKVVAVSDYQGDIYSSQGLDILSIRQYSVGAFMVWAIAIGGKPFISISWYHPTLWLNFDSTLYSGYFSNSSRKT